jgi:hypothetical protein
VRRVVELITLLAVNSGLSQDEHDALRAVDDTADLGRCGDAALLVQLELAVELQRHNLALRVLRSGGPRVAARALGLLLDPPVGASGLVPAAAELAALHGATGLAVDVQSYYAALTEDDVALDRADKAWVGVAMDALEPERFVTRRRGGQRVVQSREQSSMLRPRSSILDVVIPSVLNEPNLRWRLEAHAADMGVDPGWVRFWADPSAARAKALGLQDRGLLEVKELAHAKVEHELWATFQRSRWWLSDDD